MPRALLALLVLTISGVVLSLAAREAPADALEAGFAEIDITPKVAPGGKPVYLAGFGSNRLATGVNDPLFARAVVFRDGTSKIALVSVDLVGLFHDTVQRVRGQLKGYAYVGVSSTHNHEGPDTLGLWGRSPLQSGVDPAYLALVEKRIVEAIRTADAALAPVSARIGSVKAPELLHDSRLPIVKHDDLVAVQFRGKSGGTAGLVVQWNCHPETLESKNTLVSADYVGYTVRHLRQRYRCPVVYLTGTVGGLMTSMRVPIRSVKGEELKDGTFEKTERYGVLLGQAAERAVEAARPVQLTPLRARSRQVYLPLANRLYLAARQLGVFERQAFLWQGDPYRAVAVEEIDLKKPQALRTEVAHLRLGDLDIACIPGEIYPELVLGRVVSPAEVGADYPDAPVEPAIYAQLKGPHRMLIGLACDEIGYILPKRQWDEKAPFCYGRAKGQYGEVNSLGPETGPILCRAFADLVRGK